jgi:anthranilate synthase component 1
MVYDDVVAFDHAAQRLVIVANVRPEGDVAGAYEAARRRLDETTAALLEPTRAASLPPATQAPTSFRCEQPDAAFLRSVTRVKEHIRKGDAFQVVLSRRFARAVREDPVLSYRMLRRLNPSPYMYYLSFGEAGDGTVVAGTSPEMLARVKDGTIETHPIAGTRPRGADEEEDRRREAELRADPKEIAEHVMLVDLGRNDLGKVAVPGTVSVTDLMGVERYSHVMHLVSRVRATLRPGTSPLAALMACFPAGTVTGAPKVRAMEIIERLEGVRRGIYGGAVTYFDFHGNLDSCIAIRTLVFQRGLALAQAGAGIVADSDPGRELQETRHKAGVLLQAVDSVERPVAARQKESA